MWVRGGDGGWLTEGSKGVTGRPQKKDKKGGEEKEM